MQIQIVITSLTRYCEISSLISVF